MYETAVVCKFCQQNVDWKCGDTGQQTRKVLYCTHFLMVILAYEKQINENPDKLRWEKKERGEKNNKMDFTWPHDWPSWQEAMECVKEVFKC